MSSVKDQSLTGFKWSAIGEISTHGISFLLGLFIARLLMPEDFGVIGMLAIFMAISEQFVNCGFGKLPSTNLSSVMHKVTFPILAQYQEDNDRLLHVYHRYLAMTSMVIFFIMMLLAVVAKPLIGILLTEKWLGAVPFLQVFCLAFMFDSVCNLNNNLMFVKGWSGLFFKLEVIKKIIVTPFLLLAIPLGVMAICFVAVIHTAVDILCSTYYLRKLMGVELRPYGALVRYFFLSLLACTPAYFVCEQDISPWLSLSVGITISTVLYLGLLRHDNNLKELFRIVSNLIPVRP